jgi:hypothetical protein
MCAIYSILRTSTRPPTKDEIIERINEKLNIKMCPSSIEKDMYSLKYDFGITIRYSRFLKGYYIPDANKSLDKEFVINLLIYLSLQDVPFISNILDSLIE